MARVTVDEVAAVYKNAGDDNSVLQTFIDTATLIVDEELVIVTPAFSEARLKQIELYLAAHFATMSFEAGGLVRKKIDDVEEEYQELSEGLKGLERTRFGQQVILLDSSGKLGQLAANPVKALFGILSAPSSSTTTVFDT